MASSFKGEDVFGSGPHEFFVGRVGRRVVSLAALARDSAVEGSGEFGDLELRVTVKGRLVAEDDAGLWALRDALAAESAYEVTGGVLEDGHGHEWAEMKLLTVDEDGAVARGRELSIGYTAEFGHLAI